MWLASSLRRPYYPYVWLTLNCAHVWPNINHGSKHTRWCPDCEPRRWNRCGAHCLGSGYLPLQRFVGVCQQRLLWPFVGAVASSYVRRSSPGDFSCRLFERKLRIFLDFVVKSVKEPEMLAKNLNAWKVCFRHNRWSFRIFSQSCCSVCDTEVNTGLQFTVKGFVDLYLWALNNPQARSATKELFLRKVTFEEGRACGFVFWLFLIRRSILELWAYFSPHLVFRACHQGRFGWSIWLRQETHLDFCDSSWYTNKHSSNSFAAPQWDQVPLVPVHGWIMACFWYQFTAE